MKKLILIMLCLVGAMTAAQSQPESRGLIAKLKDRIACRKAYRALYESIEFSMDSMKKIAAAYPSDQYVMHDFECCPKDIKNFFKDCASCKEHFKDHEKKCHNTNFPCSYSWDNFTAYHSYRGLFYAPNNIYCFHYCDGTIEVDADRTRFTEEELERILNERVYMNK